MKTLYLIILTFVIGSLTAQSPQSFKYQGVARNSDGTPITNTAIGLKLIIRSGTPDGTDVYSETFTPTSNGIGIFTVNIGEGTPVTGNFSDIDWGADKYFLNVAMNADGSSNYTDMGTTQFLSVPYSLYTASIYVKYSNDTLWIGDQYVVIGGGSPQGGTVTDYDGNVYHTVEIGNQTWMKENLRTTHYSDGTPIDSVWVYDNNESYAEPLGRLYNWDAAMNGAGSSNGNPSGVQGACPDGWHLPSKAEFNELISAAGGEVLGGCALKSTNNSYWETPNNNNNQTGFSALGAGYRTETLHQYTSLKEFTGFWTTTEDNTNIAQKAGLKWNLCSASVSSLLGTKKTGYSVRCVKD